jgi:chemotaxis protein CheD
MMKTPASAIEIYLQPGDFYFGTSDTRIKTILGSCVAITLWHPARRIGGMCHYLLPSRNKRSTSLDGRYADEAMEMFLLEISRYKTKICEYHVKLFGGGDMFPRSNSVNVSAKNIDVAYRLFKRYKIEPMTQDLGSSGHRQIIFDIWNGNVWVRYQPLKTAQPSR